MAGTSSGDPSLSSGGFFFFFRVAAAGRRREVARGRSGLAAWTLSRHDGAVSDIFFLFLQICNPRLASLNTFHLVGI
jgi:hypothetical protein